MNHLGCDATMRVVFDAGDAMVEAEDEEEEDQETGAQGGAENNEELHALIDISKLKGRSSSVAFPLHASV
jgi:hypothetical protein